MDKIQFSKHKTQLKFFQNISNYYDELNYRRQNGKLHFEEDVFNKKPQSFSNIYQEVLLLVKVLQTKPEVEGINTNCYDFYYTVIINRDEKEIVNGRNENNENDFNKYEAYNIPNHHVGVKPHETIIG